MTKSVSVYVNEQGYMRAYGDSGENALAFLHFTGGNGIISGGEVDSFLAMAKIHGYGVHQMRDKEPKIKMLSVKQNAE